MNNKKSAEHAVELELQELGDYLARQDFSRESDPAAVLRQVRSRSIQKQQEDNRMKNKQRIRRPVMIAASLLVAAVVSVSFVRPSFAQEMLERVLNSVHLGHIEVAQMDGSHPTEFPEAWKGKIFDKQGNPVTSFNPMPAAIFNAAGRPSYASTGISPLRRVSRSSLTRKRQSRSLPSRRQRSWINTPSSR